MPPKKKSKLSEAPAEPENESNTPGENAAKLSVDYDPVADPWTDEQETALLKAIIRWKPVGMHKHFRMIAISEFMKSQGYAPSHAEHTRIPGIWKKLGTLYNLPALDEREDSLITDISDNIDASNDRYCPFQLPDDEYGDMMFERRLATEASESPVASRHSRQAESRRGSTVADTDEARSSPAPSRGRKSTRGRQATRGARARRFQASEGSRTRKDTATGDEASDDTGGANDEEEASDAAKEDSEIEDDEEEEAGESPAPKSTRAKTARSKGGRGAGTRRTGRRR